MTSFSREVLQQWQVRKNKKQKEAFRARLTQVLQEAGYEVQVEKHKGLWPSHNVIAGDPDRAKVLLTAHYDTCAVLPFPNFITPRNFLWYLMYQLVLVAVFLAVVLAAALLTSRLLQMAGLDELMAPAAAVVTYALLFFEMWWMLDGKASRHTANDNTSGVVTLLEVALTLPGELRDGVCFVWFDNEERGLFGSRGFAKHHRDAQKNTLVINFDCVSDGDSLQFFPGKKVKKTADTALLRRCYLPAGDKTVEVVDGFGFYPSDQAAFRRGVGVCALKKSKFFGWYMDRIHTRRDTVMDETNIDLLRAGTVRLLQAVQDEDKTHA